MASDLKFMWHFPKQKEKLNCPKTPVLSNQSPKTALWNLPNMILNLVSSLESAGGFLVAGSVFMLRQGSWIENFNFC